MAYSYADIFSIFVFNNIVGYTFIFNSLFFPAPDPPRCDKSFRLSKENWILAFEGKAIFEGPRFLAYRQMFLNHLVHHRAQLGVYLRLNGVPVPAIYGPSADEPWG